MICSSSFRKAATSPPRLRLGRLPNSLPADQGRRRDRLPGRPRWRALAPRRGQVGRDDAIAPVGGVRAAASLLARGPAHGASSYWRRWAGGRILLGPWLGPSRCAPVPVRFFWKAGDALACPTSYGEVTRTQCWPFLAEGRRGSGQVYGDSGGSSFPPAGPSRGSQLTIRPSVHPPTPIGLAFPGHRPPTPVAIGDSQSCSQKSDISRAG